MGTLQAGARPMSERHDIEQVLAALEDARTVMRGVDEGLSESEALECLRAVLDDAVMVQSLSRIRRRPIPRLRK